MKFWLMAGGGGLYGRREFCANVKEDESRTRRGMRCATSHRRAAATVNTDGERQGGVTGGDPCALIVLAFAKIAFCVFRFFFLLTGGKTGFAHCALERKFGVSRTASEGCLAIAALPPAHARP